MSITALKQGKINIAKLDKDGADQYQDLKKVTSNFEEMDDEMNDTAKELVEYINAMSPEAWEKETAKEEPKKKEEQSAPKKRFRGVKMKRAKVRNPMTKGMKSSPSEKADKPTTQRPPAEKEDRKPDPCGKKKMTKESCDPLINDLRSLVGKYTSTKTKKTVHKPVRKRTLATLVSENIVATIKRVVENEKRAKGADNIDKNKFQRTITAGMAFLTAIKKDSGGISNDNEQMIANFEKAINEILENFNKKK